MPGIPYILKASFEIGRGEFIEDVVVYMDEYDGRRGKCYYCGKPGRQIKFVVKEVLVSDQLIAPGTPIYYRVIRKFRRLSLDGRCLCDRRRCEYRLGADRNTETVNVE